MTIEIWPKKIDNCTTCHFERVEKKKLSEPPCHGCMQPGTYLNYQAIEEGV